MLGAGRTIVAELGPRAVDHPVLPGVGENRAMRSLPVGPHAVTPEHDDPTPGRIPDRAGTLARGRRPVLGRQSMPAGLFEDPGVVEHRSIPSGIRRRGSSVY